MAMQISSSEFASGEQIPLKNTCDGKDVSPPIEWSGQPSGTNSLALVCEDPDAPFGTFTHWLLYDIDPRTHELAEGVRDVGKAGRNSFNRIGYGGPCPPRGEAHRYIFRVFAAGGGTIGLEGLSRAEVMN